MLSDPGAFARVAYFKASLRVKGHLPDPVGLKASRLEGEAKPPPTAACLGAKGIRTSNSIERLFGEQRRRTKVIPRFFDEKSCLKLVFAALIRAARGFRPLAMNQLALAQLESLRKEKELPPKPSADYELANKLREAA